MKRDNSTVSAVAFIQTLVHGGAVWRSLLGMLSRHEVHPFTGMIMVAATQCMNIVINKVDYLW